MKKLICLILALLLACAAVCAYADEENKPLKVIFCCDEGYMNDDALALSMLVKLEKRGEVEILGIALTGGNNFIDAEHTCEYGVRKGSYTYLKEFLALIGREDIPVYRGTDYPLGFNESNIKDIDGIHRTYVSDDGKIKDRIIMDDAFGALWHFNDCDGELVNEEDASDFIVEQINKYPNEVAIIAVGPTTDVARAVLKDSSIAEKAEGVYIMGGAFGNWEIASTVRGEYVSCISGANTTNIAEYNVFYDPEALAVVLQSGFKKVVITPAACNEPVLEDLGSILATSLDKQSNAIMWAWVDYHMNNTQNFPYWDPITIYAMMCPEMISSELNGYVTVNTDTKSERYGETIYASEAVYQMISDENKVLFGKAEIVLSMKNFWYYVIPLLSK